MAVRRAVTTVDDIIRTPLTIGVVLQAVKHDIFLGKFSDKIPVVFAVWHIAIIEVVIVSR